MFRPTAAPDVQRQNYFLAFFLDFLAMVISCGTRLRELVKEVHYRRMAPERITSWPSSSTS